MGLSVLHRRLVGAQAEPGEAGPRKQRLTMASFINSIRTREQAASTLSEFALGILGIGFSRRRPPSLVPITPSRRIREGRLPP